MGWGSGPDWDFRVDYLVWATARVGAGLARAGKGWGREGGVSGRVRREGGGS